MKQILLLAAFILSATTIQAQKIAGQFQFNGEQSVFTENKGQVVDMNGQPVPNVLAKASMPGLDMYLTQTGVTYVMLQYTEDLTAKPHPVFANDKKFKVTCSRVDVALTGATIATEQLHLADEAGYQSNYYRTADAKGQLALSHFKNMTVQNVYAGIDWIWKFNTKGHLEYEFVVHPGADPSLIKMQYSYADLKTEKNNLVISTRIGSITEGPLLATNSGNKVAINYDLNATSKAISFVPSAYDKTKNLVIDPPLALNWSAQFGGSFSNGLHGVTTDKNAGIYLCGFTTSSDFPLFNPHYGNEYYDSTFNGNSDAIILKIDTNQTLKYATFLGGPGNDFANSICFGSANGASSVFVTGAAQTGFPIRNGSATCTGQDAFVSGFNCGNLSLFYSSFFGGSGTDEGLKIYITPNTSYVYFVGYTNSTTSSFPNVYGGGYYQATITGQEAFIGKLSYNIIYQYVNTNWLTKFGGSADDYATGVTTDTLGNAVVCGYTNSTNIPLAHADSSYNQAANAGGYDGFITKFDDNNNLLNSTYYGGSGDDYFNDVTTGINGNFAFTGRTTSTNFPLRNIGGYGYYHDTLSDASGDAFIVKAANNLTVKWATYFGGSLADVGTSITTDSVGQMYVTGFTFSHNFPVLSNPYDFFQANNHGNADGFIARFTDLGIRLWATYKGDSCYQYPASIAYDRIFKKLYVAGQGMLACLGDSMGQSVPDTGQVNQQGISSIGFAWGFGGGGNQATQCAGANINLTYLAEPCPNQCNGKAKIVLTGGQAPYHIKWSDGDTTTVDSSLCPSDSWVEVEDATGCPSSAYVLFNPLNITPSNVSVTCVPGPGSVSVGARGGNGFSYNYQWSSYQQPFSGFFTGGDSSILYAPDTGTYNVTVTDTRGCTVSGSSTINYYNQGPIGNIEIYQYPGCNDNNGTVALNNANTDSLFPNGNVVWADQNYNILATGPVLSGINTYQTYYAIDSAYCYNGQTAPVYYSINLASSYSLAYLQTSPPSNCVNSDGIGQVIYQSVSYTVSGINPDDQYYDGTATVDDYQMQYYWSDGDFGYDDSITYRLPSGDISVQMWAANSCPSNTLYSTFNYPTPIVQSLIDSAYCPGNGGGSIDASISYSQNFGMLSYQWNTGDYTSSIYNQPSGFYSVTVTDQLLCVASATFYIPQGTPVEINLTATPALCNGGNGTVTVTGGSGAPLYQGTGTFSSPAGNNSFTITDNLGCTATGNIFVGQPANPLTITVDSISGAICSGGTETVLVTANGGTAPYTGTGTLFEPVGTNIITVHDSHGCTASQNLVVHSGGSNPIIPANSYTTILCYGDTTTLTITATGGRGTITGTGVFRITGGTHYYTLNDSVGCSVIDTVVVIQPSHLTVSLNAAGITCYPGSVTALPNGGSPLYMFQWSVTPGNFGINSSITVANTGAYSVTVQDENLCTASATTNVSYNNNVSPNASLDVISYPTCGNNDGIVALINHAGNVSWFTSSHLGNVGNLLSVGDTLNTLGSGAGAGCVAIDSGSCYNGVPAQYYLQLSPDVGDLLITDTAATTCAPANGKASLYVYPQSETIYYGGTSGIRNIIYTGNFPAVTQLWSNGETGRSVSDLSAGTYTVTLTDGACQYTRSVTITGPNPPVVTPVVNATVCYGGSINVSNVSGNAPYTFTWSDGASTNVLTGLNTGIYSVTVTDRNHCSVADTFNIVSAVIPIVVNNTFTPILCFGDSTTLTITATGGHGTIGGTGTFRVVAGTHYYTLIDSTGCSVVDTVVVGQPAQITINFNTVGITCYPGSVSALPNGGSPLYMFQWSTSPGNFVSNSSITVADIGTYSVTVQDENLCSATGSVYVDYDNSSTHYDITFVQFPSCGLNNGVIAYSSPDPSSITWYKGTTIIARGDTLTHLNLDSFQNVVWPDVYSVVDSGNCINGLPDSIEIALAYGTQIYTSAVWNNPSGCNSKDGAINLSVSFPMAYSWSTNQWLPVTLNNFGGLTFTWSTGLAYDLDTILNYTTTPGISGASSYLNMLNPGIYTETITDGNCVTVDTFNLTALQPPLQANYQETNPGCSGSNNGAIQLISLVNDTTMQGIHYIDTFAWSNNATTSSISNLTAGTYTITITGPNACPVIDTFHITSSGSTLAITNTITPIACYNGNATVTITATGGTLPYSGTGTFTEAPGSYVLPVSDASGCSANDSFVVAPSLATSVLVTNNTIVAIPCHGQSATITVGATGGISPYSGTGVYNRPAGNYIINVVDSLGCIARDTVNINQPGILYVTNVVDPVRCYGGNATINLNCHGGTNPYTGTGSFARPAGNYVFAITDANGCVATDTVVVTQPTPFVATDTVTANPLCYGGTGIVHITATGGTSPYYNIGNIVEQAGNYLLVALDANGCADTLYATITQPTAVNLTLQWLDTIVHCKDTAKVLITATGGNGPYTGTGTFTYTHNGIYNISVTDGNGCAVDTSIALHFDTCTDVENVTADFGITIYPNPATDKLYVKFSSQLSGPADVRLYTVDGKLIQLKTIGAGAEQCELDCNQLAAGVYVLRTVITNKEYNFKVVVTR